MASDNPSVEDQIEEALGRLHSDQARQPFGPTPIGGATDIDGRLVGLENDVRKLHNAMRIAARQIDDLRNKVGGRE